MLKFKGKGRMEIATDRINDVVVVRVEIDFMNRNH